MPTRKTGSAILNKEGRKAWRPDGPSQGKCIWEMHGVWGWDVNKDEAVVLRESYFVKHPMTGKKVRMKHTVFPKIQLIHELSRLISTMISSTLS